MDSEKKEELKTSSVPSICNFFSKRNLKLERDIDIFDYLDKFMLHSNIILIPAIEHMFWEKCKF